MDEKRLEELEANWLDLEPAPAGPVRWAIVQMCQSKLWEDRHELIRLARLGLWAEKYGVSAIKETNSLAEYCGDSWLHKPLRDALAALPTESK